MDIRDGVPQIDPGSMGLIGMDIEVACDVDPAQFPNGLELIVCVPGSLAPLGRLLVKTGCMVVAIPPGPAKEMRDMVRKARTLQPGNVDAPGIRGG